MNTNTAEMGFEDETLCAEIYDRCLPELLAIEPGDVMTVNLDIAVAVCTVLGKLPTLQGLREAIARELPAFDLTKLDRLEDYARCLSHAQTRAQTSPESANRLRAVATEAGALRTQLYRDAQALACRGIISASGLEQYKGLNGYLNTASDLLILADVLTPQWPKIQGRCGATLEELQRAAKLAVRIHRLLGLREQEPARATETADMRARAFTLFLKAYSQLRRAVVWLRWDENDADRFAPSLYVKRRRNPGADADAPELPDAPETPEVTPTSPFAHPQTVLTAAPFASGPALVSLRAPLPGNNPFLQ